MDVQRSQHHAQAHIALLKIGDGGHNLLIGGGAACLLQLSCQGGQLSCMTGIVAYHVLHQSNQLFHGGVLAATATACAAAGAVVVVMMIMVVMVVVMAMIMVMMVMIVVVMHR